jgi:DNA-binding transcriptional LysR family regulator
MELRHLRYFVAVAEELNFTRAAKRLGINQPPLSSQIHQLEKELGAPLFRRRARGVELTDAGKLLLEETRVILRQIEHVSTGVRRSGRGEMGQIIVGSAGGTYFHPLIPTIIREYGKQYPEVILTPRASSTALLIARVRAGQNDVAFIRPPIHDDGGLVIEPVVDEEMVIVVPSGHPLSGSASAPLAALANETFVFYPRELNPIAYDSVISACQRSGFSPTLGQTAPQVVSVIPLVAAGLGVSILPHSTSHILAEGVRTLSIEGDVVHAEISLAYRLNDHSGAVQNFVEVARRVTQAASRSNGQGAKPRQGTKPLPSRLKPKR